MQHPTTNNEMVEDRLIEKLPFKEVNVNLNNQPKGGENPTT